MALLDTFVEVALEDPQNFLKIKETLTRIGVSSKTENKLYQSCHILHKRGKYYIVHFKELFALDGLSDGFPDQDKGRRNTIAKLLEEWGLLKILNKDVTNEPLCPINHMKILPHSEKKDWQLIPKYTIGTRHKSVDKSDKTL
jgi:hypothetical protein